MATMASFFRLDRACTDPSRSFCRFLRSSDMSKLSYITTLSNSHIQRGGKNVQFQTMQGQNLAIHHHVHGRIQIKLHARRRFALRQRMLNMGSIIKRRQVSDQPQSPDWSPADVFDQSTVYFSIGRDHHGAAGELAVVEGKEKAGPPV